MRIMKKTFLLASVAVLSIWACTASAKNSPADLSDLNRAISADYDSRLESLYEHFHANPELSFVENKTAARMAEELRSLGYEVTEGVGGTGVVAVLKNGEGPTVMMRADMDGLPVQEKSGLSYASTAKQVDWDGKQRNL